VKGSGYQPTPFSLLRIYFLLDMKTNKLTITQYASLLTNQKAHAGIVFSTPDLLCVFEELEEAGLLDITPQEINSYRKEIDLTRHSTIIVRPPKGGFWICPFDPKEDLEKVKGYLRNFPMLSSCWIFYDLQPFQALIRFQAEQNLNKVGIDIPENLVTEDTLLETEIANMNPDFYNDDVIQDRIRLIDRNYRLIAENFVTELFNVLIISYTNFLKSSSEDTVESLVERYIKHFPKKGNVGYNLIESLWGIIDEYDVKLTEFINGEYNKVYMAYPVMNNNIVVLKYDIDYRVIIHEYHKE